MTVNLGFVHPLSIVTSAHQQKLQLEMPGTTCAGYVLSLGFKEAATPRLFPVASAWPSQWGGWATQGANFLEDSDNSQGLMIHPKGKGAAGPLASPLTSCDKGRAQNPGLCPLLLSQGFFFSEMLIV